MTEPTNEERAEWALMGLRAFAACTGQLKLRNGKGKRCDTRQLERVLYDSDYDEDMGIIITDFLCDLMHFCDVEEVDFAQLLQNAEGHYQYELQEASEESDDEEDTDQQE